MTIQNGFVFHLSGHLLRYCVRTESLLAPHGVRLAEWPRNYFGSTAHAGERPGCNPKLSAFGRWSGFIEIFVHYQRR